MKTKWNNLNIRTIQARVDACFCQLDYNFERFEMQTFLRCLEQKCGKEIQLLPWAMPAPNLLGFWVTTDKRNYIFYEFNTYAFHQRHFKLHECSHIILKHPTLNLDSGEMVPFLRNILRNLIVGDCDFAARDIFSKHSHEKECEAELLARRIQNQILRNADPTKLDRTRLSKEECVSILTAYIETLEQHDDTR